MGELDLSPEGIERALQFLTEGERIEASALMAREACWEPMIDPERPDQPTPQQTALDSPADTLLYGGAAGGGKTDLLIGLALTRHRRSILFRREYGQLHGIIDRVEDLLGGRKGYSSQDRSWAVPARFTPGISGGRRIEFGACQRSGDEVRYQGRPHDLKGFDEITHFHETQFRFLTGWLRTATPAQRCRIVCTGNPPAGAQGGWVIKYWGPWLDAAHPSPALPGELRWFAMIGGEEREVESASPFSADGEMITPQSRTFVPSAIEDNPFLMGTGYKAMLQALPEPLRSQMLKGDFTVGRAYDPWQIIPTGWAQQAQARWVARDRPRKPMTSLGADVARGGRDRTVLTPCHGDWLDQQLSFSGADTPDGPRTAALIVSALRDGAPVQIDIIGIGASVFDHLKGNGIACVGMNGAEASHATDRSGRLRFINKRAEWWWGMREALDPNYGSGLALPPDPELLADLCAPRWKLTARGIQVESKDEIHSRIGRSPDKGDSAVYAVAAPPLRTAATGHQLPASENTYRVHGW